MNWWERVKKQKTLLIIIMVLVVALIGLGVWWFAASQQSRTPERQYETAFVKEVLPNIRDTVFLEEVKEKLEAGEIEVVYRQGHPKEHTTLTKYYVKYKGEPGYHLLVWGRNDPVFFEGKLQTVSVGLLDALRLYKIPVLEGKDEIEKDILPNAKEEISADTFEKKLKAGEIKLIYSWPEDLEIPEYYVELKNRPDYYLFVRPTGYIINVEVKGMDTTMLLGVAFQLYDIYPRDVPTNPKAPYGPAPMIVVAVVGVGLIAALFWAVGRQFSLGKEFCKIAERFAGEKITFDEVAGIEEAKQEILEVKDMIENPPKYKDLGAKIPKGILLVGPPGTGKTMLAKAMATETRVSFLGISGSEFIEMFAGVGAARIRDLFEGAKKRIPCIVFIDEVDAIGAKRGPSVSGADDERHATLNQIMTEMDGFESGSGITVIAATNREDVLDPAFIRPGRFDRKVYVGYANVKGREAILKVHVRGKPMAEDVDLKELARSMPLGSSGADLANIVNEAAIRAGVEGKEEIDKTCFKYAKDKIRLGPEKKDDSATEEEKKAFAYHEAGHALAAKMLSHIPPLGKVSIVPRGQSHGVVEVLPEKDQYIKTKGELLEYLAYYLASIAAEEEIFGPEGRTTGAQNDLEQATKLAAGMVIAYGMSEEFGLVSLKALLEASQTTQPITEKMMQAVDKLNSQALRTAKTIISENRSKLDALALALLEQEDINGKLADKIIEEA